MTWNTQKASTGPRMWRGHFAVHPLDQRQDLGEPGRVADVGRRAGLPLDVAHDEDARLGVDDLGRDAGVEGGLARRALVEAHDLVDGDIVADADDVARTAVLDDEVDVGEAAAEALRPDGTLPDRKAGDPFPGIDPRHERHEMAERPRIGSGARMSGFEMAGMIV